MATPRIAVLNSDVLQQKILGDSLLRLGFEVVLNAPPARMSETLLTDTSPDAWLLTLTDDDDVSGEVLEQLLHGEIPVLFGMDEAPDRHCTSFLRWEKKLLTKLQDLTHAPAPAATVVQLNRRDQQTIALPKELVGLSRQIPIQIWVLGASLGGPEAVKEFLDVLPAGLPVAFVYAQHIDARFEEALCQAVGRHSAYQLKNATNAMALQCGDVLIAPVANRFDIVGMDRICTTDKAWEGPYGPSIDGVIETVYNHAHQRFGCILFSGMGSDGAESLAAIPDNVPVWAQSPGTCGNASMPESAIGTGRVTFSGDPYQLAAKLVEQIRIKWTEEYERNADHQCG